MALTQINKAGLDAIALDHVFTIGASGSSAYTFQGEGLNGTVNNPTLYLTRGKTYRFENGSGGHPIRIQSTPGVSGTAYNTGVTNNAGSGTVIVEVQHDAPDVLYYQCTSHAAMNGILYITGALADGGVTTAKIADNAITSAKIAAGTVGTTDLANVSVTHDKLANLAVETGNIVDANVTTAKIADQAVTAAKLASGVQTTINNNADNRVITGSNTANTLNGESNVVIDSSGKVGIGVSSPTRTIDAHVTDSGANYIHLTNATTGAGDSNGTFIGLDAAEGALIWNQESTNIQFATSDSERMRIDSAGDIFIGTSTDIAPSNGTNLCVSDGTVSRLVLEKQSTRKFEIGVQNFLNIYDTTADAERFRISADGEVTKPKQPYVMVSRGGANQSVVNTSLTYIQFNQEHYDTGNDYNPSNYRFTAPVDGIYQVNVQVQYNGNVNQTHAGVYKNGLAPLGVNNTFDPWCNWGDNIRAAVFVHAIKLSANDYIQGVTYQGSGSTQQLEQNRTKMTVYLLG